MLEKNRFEPKAFCREATGEDEKSYRIFGMSFCSGCQVFLKSFCSRCQVFPDPFCSQNCFGIETLPVGHFQLGASTWAWTLSVGHFQIILQNGVPSCNHYKMTCASKCSERYGTDMYVYSIYIDIWVSMDWFGT